MPVSGAFSLLFALVVNGLRSLLIMKQHGIYWNIFNRQFNNSLISWKIKSASNMNASFISNHTTIIICA